MITRHFLICGAIAALGLFGESVWAQNALPTPPTPPTVEAPDAPPPPANNAADNQTDGPRPADDISDADPPIVWTRDRAERRPFRRFNSNDEMVTIGGDSTLPAGRSSDSVVSVLGSSTSSGDVRNAVVSVLGNTRIEGGNVGDAAVSVLGNTYINSEVDGEAVAVLGDVELGPKARVRGDVVVIGGRLIRDPAAEMGGTIQQIMTIPQDALVGLKTWLKTCVRYLRPLAFERDLGWAWTIALGFLALYALFAVVFRDPLDRCVRTLQERPGETIVASVLTMILSPVFYTVLALTVIGIAFIPIATFGIFLATLFGKAVVLAWIGRGILKIADKEESIHSAIAVLIGGVIILLLYVVPVLGFLVFNLLGILGLGVVVYTWLLSTRAKRRSSPPPTSGARAGGARPAPGAPGAPAGAAAGAAFSGMPGGATPYTAGFGADALPRDAAGAATAWGGTHADASGASRAERGGVGGGTESGAGSSGASGFADELGAGAGGTAGFGSESGAGGATGFGSEAGSGASGAAGFGGDAGTGATGAAGFAGEASAGAGGTAGFGAPESGSFAGSGGSEGGGAGAGTPPPSNGMADALSLPRAGFWIRMLALLIDAVIVGVVFNVLDHHTRLQLVALAAYGAIMWKLKGTTIGGIVCNLKIVRIDGREIDWSTAIVRALACFLSLVVCGLGFIWIAFDPGRQAWHDKIAGTAVLRVPQGVSLL